MIAKLTLTPAQMAGHSPLVTYLLALVGAVWVVAILAAMVIGWPADFKMGRIPRRSRRRYRVAWTTFGAAIIVATALTGLSLFEARGQHSMALFDYYPRVILLGIHYALILGALVEVYRIWLLSSMMRSRSAPGVGMDLRTRRIYALGIVLAAIMTVILIP